MKISRYTIETRVAIEGLIYDASRESYLYEESHLQLIYNALTKRAKCVDTCVSFYDNNNCCILRIYQEYDGYRILVFAGGAYPVADKHVSVLNRSTFMSMVRNYL